MFKAQKYFTLLQVPSPKYLTCVILSIHFLLCNTCQPPDYPEGGSYTPVKKRYLPGDKIVYSCKDKLTRLGKETSICQTTGKWSGSTPFCDSPTRVRNPTASSDPNREVSNTVDGSPNTCYHSGNGTGHSLKVYLDPPAAVNLIRIYLKKGKAFFKVSTIQNKHPTSTPCSSFERELDDNQWVTINCKDNEGIAEYILIQDYATKGRLAICEVEVYVKDDVWCMNPPIMFIPNGRLEVSRDKATLHCVEGYTEKGDIRIVCERNTWTGPNLQCEEILCDTVVGNESLIGGEWHIEGRGSKLSIGTRRRLVCREGFYMTGKPSTVTCLGNGTWSKTSATCVEILCETAIGNDTFIGGEWQTEGRISKFFLGTKRKLVCKEGYQINGKPDIVTCLKTGLWTKTSATCKANQPEKKDSIRIIAIAVGATVALLILLLLGLTIFLIQKKRSREVVVIYKPGEDSYIPASLATASSGGGSDGEYSTVYYEAINNAQYPPTPKRPPHISPRINAGYSKPVDDRSMPRSTDTSKQLPVDIAFGTLKSSALYNSMN